MRSRRVPSAETHREFRPLGQVWITGSQSRAFLFTHLPETPHREAGSWRSGPPDNADVAAFLGQPRAQAKAWSADEARVLIRDALKHIARFRSFSPCGAAAAHQQISLERLQGGHALAAEVSCFGLWQQTPCSRMDVPKTGVHTGLSHEATTFKHVEADSSSCAGAP